MDRINTEVWNVVVRAIGVCNDPAVQKAARQLWNDMVQTTKSANEFGHETRSAWQRSGAAGGTLSPARA